MIYEFPISIDPDTTEPNAISQLLRLSSGTITEFGIEFPPGCAALAHVVIIERDQQLWPANVDQSFASDALYLEYHPNYVLNKAPYELTAQVWNEDVRHEHTPIIRFEIVPQGNTLIERLMRMFTLG